MGRNVLDTKEGREDGVRVEEECINEINSFICSIDDDKTLKEMYLLLLGMKCKKLSL